MKKLSKELLKSYTFLIIVFMTISTITTLYTWHFLLKQSKIDLNNVDTFLSMEFTEPEHKDIEVFFNDAISESPKVNGLYIILSYKGKTFQEKGTPYLGELPISDEIQKIGLLDYYVINNQDKNIEGEEVNYTIIRGLQKEKHFLLKILEIYIIGNLIIIISGFMISRYFYKKIIPQLTLLEDATNRVNIKSFESDIRKEDFFQEFSNILISYENMLSRLEKQTASQIDFVNNASHELKTPIFVIGGYVSLIKRWGLNNEEVSKEALDFIQSEVKSMGVLIEKLLFLAKQDKIDFFHEEVDLEEIITEIVHEMEIIYPGQTFNLNLTPININSDESLVKQLIRNLVDNAIKYGDGNLIEIAMKKTEGAFISISDKGIGMSQEDLSRSFEKFFRADKSRSRQLKSHGLGLSIVKQILDLLKGNINIKSEKDKGTTVEIFLPVNIEE
jgi:signal transduction histidine kinase